MKRACHAVLLGLLFAVPAATAAPPVCTPTGEGQVRCAINQLSDCNALNDYPYARNLFCPAAFRAVQDMLAQLSQTLGTAGPASGFFYYYQTLEDPTAQTTIPCLETPAPFPGGSFFVEGAGVPLCHLLAYATSVGPGAPPDASSGNPVPSPLRGFPGYFGVLYAPTTAFPLEQFRTGSVFDPVVKSLGAAGRNGFLADYPAFSASELYDPDGGFHRDNQYRGMSGGGGAGWGGEIAIVHPSGELLTLLAFGGGGGGGMTSWKKSPNQAITALGAGGGGGVQFGNAYRVKNTNYNGLGLGAGTSSNEAAVQYSYNDYDGSGNPPKPAHQYNTAVIDQFQLQLGNLKEQLQSRFQFGRTIVLKGGGGMGGGTEYLTANGQEYEPHAVSTQAGFQYSYEFRTSSLSSAGPSADLAASSAEEEDLYEVLGDYFRDANQQAFEECGRDYSNFGCMCPKAHAIVICLVGKRLGDASKIPSWLQEQHCGGDTDSHPDPAFTSYQRLLLKEPNPGSSCDQTLRRYFIRMNTSLKQKY